MQMVLLLLEFNNTRKNMNNSNYKINYDEYFRVLFVRLTNK